MVPRARRPPGPLPLLALLAGGALTVSCASHGAPPAAPTVTPEGSSAIPSACLVITDSVGPARTITAAFADSSDARRARVASTLQSPVRLDCEGRPSPGIATSWSHDTSGRFWTLELDGTAAAWTASALAAAWRASLEASAALRASGVESLLPLDDRRLVVGFSRPELELPPLFADRALGVAPRDSGSTILAQPPAADLRDAVDQGVDLVQTDDPALLDYAGRRPGLAVIPLPWSRSYVLLLPAGSAGIGSAIPPDTAGFRESLAREVVRADARAAAAGPRERPDSACGPTPGTSATRRSDAVAYPAADRVARDLAERLVALAGEAGLTTRGLTDATLSSALRGGTERAFVLAVPLHAAVPCREGAAWPAGSSAVPLVETRSHAIVRRGTPPVVVEWDGALRPGPDTARSVR